MIFNKAYILSVKEFNCLLLVCKNTVDFCILTLMHLIINFSSSFNVTLDFFEYNYVV